jgi:TolB-like protein
MEPVLTCPPFSEALINEQLQKIFDDPSFSDSEILRRFLQYIVRETLAGRANMIKEYTIGVNVLKKPADFKPQYDAIVRIHAGRLRRALSNYYKVAGINDSLEISIPKGNYVPVFRKIDSDFGKQHRRAGDNQPLNTSSSIRIAIMPFRCYEKNSIRLAFADSLGQQLSAEFGLFPDFSVIAYYATRRVADEMSDVRKLGSSYGAQYVVTGNVQFEGKRLRVRVQLSDVARGDQIWAGQYEQLFELSSSFKIQDDIVAQVVSALAGFYGVIVQQTAGNPDKANMSGFGDYSALVWYHRFYAGFNSNVFMQALRAMEFAVNADPEYEMAWACLGELYLHSHLFNFQIKEDPVVRGLHCAHKALQINPYCQQAYITHAWANVYLKNKTACIIALEHAIGINPNAASMIGCAGTIMICAGEYEKGMGLLNRSIRLNRSYPPIFNISMCLYYLKSGDYLRAVYWSEKLNNVSFIWCSIVRVASRSFLLRADMHRMDQAFTENEIRDIASVRKDFISKWLFDQALVDQLREGLELAKLPVLTVA